ncbi:MAG: hypothetical protein ACLR8P_09550 [Clostridium fessum]
MTIRTGTGARLTKDGNPIDVSDEVALQIVGIRYTMRFTAFQKYESTTIATDISDETVADILEHAADLVGVNIQESTIRVYNESSLLCADHWIYGKSNERTSGGVKGGQR